MIELGLHTDNWRTLMGWLNLMRRSMCSKSVSLLV